jgi:wobble nucleotide-excising tRNase
MKSRLEKIGTDKARDIRHLLGDPTFERPKLKQRIEEVKNDPAKYIMAEEDASAQLSTLKSGDQFSTVPPFSSTLPDFVSLANDINKLLNQTASQLAIERLKQNREVESWVRHGLGLPRFDGHPGAGAVETPCT